MGHLRVFLPLFIVDRVHCSLLSVWAYAINSYRHCLQEPLCYEKYYGNRNWNSDILWLCLFFFLETIFQTFLCLFVIRKVGQRKTLSGQQKTLSSQRKTLSSQFQSKKNLT